MFGARWSDVWDELDGCGRTEETPHVIKPRASFFSGTHNVRDLRADRAEQDNEESKRSLTELLLCTKLRVPVTRKTVAVEVDDWQEMGLVNKLAVPRRVTKKRTRVVDLPSVLSRDTVKRDVSFPGLEGTSRILNPKPLPEEEAELPPQLIPMRLSM